MTSPADVHDTEVTEVDGPGLDDELDRPFALPPDAVTRFARDGFVRLPGVLSPATVRAVEPEITSKVVELNTQHVPLAERDAYGKAFLQVENLWEHSDLVRRLVFSKRLAGIAAQLLEVDSVRLYHDQALYKEPGGGGDPLARRSVLLAAVLRQVDHRVDPAAADPGGPSGPCSSPVGSHHVEFGRDLAIKCGVGGPAAEGARRPGLRRGRRRLPARRGPASTGAGSSTGPG